MCLKLLCLACCCVGVVLVLGLLCGLLCFLSSMSFYCSSRCSGCSGFLGCCFFVVVHDFSDDEDLGTTSDRKKKHIGSTEQKQVCPWTYSGSFQLLLRDVPGLRKCAGPHRAREEKNSSHLSHGILGLKWTCLVLFWSCLKVQKQNSKSKNTTRPQCVQPTCCASLCWTDCTGVPNSCSCCDCCCSYRTKSTAKQLRYYAN